MQVQFNQQTNECRYNLTSNLPRLQVQNNQQPHEQRLGTINCMSAYPKGILILAICQVHPGPGTRRGPAKRTRARARGWNHPRVPRLDPYGKSLSAQRHDTQDNNNTDDYAGYATPDRTQGNQGTPH